MRLLNFKTLLLAAVLFVNACTTDDEAPVDLCIGVVCDPGTECQDGNCVDLTSTVSGFLTEDATWTSDRVWVLNGKVIVDDGITLTIEPGTIIKGEEGIETSASALIVARGGKLIAEGTASAPIIFTTVLDNIEVGQTAGTNLTETDNEKWGGIIMLGYAPISAKDGDTEANIEGIPADDNYGKYGGDDAADDSGSLNYVSIRHGGITIGEGNEINGLTLGGVGTGTTIQNVEVIATLDDGVEFFGGTVDATNIMVTYQGDDGIDIDQNYSGTVENFMVIHGGSDTDEALELDGPEGSTYTDGTFTLRYGTMIAKDTEKTSGADLKSKAQGNINRCSWKGYSRMVKIRASYQDGHPTCNDKSDAWTNVQTGAMIITMCEVEGTVAASEVAKVYVDDEDADQVSCLADQSADKEAVVDNMVANNSNAVVGTSSEGADESAFGWTLTFALGLQN